MKFAGVSKIYPKFSCTKRLQKWPKKNATCVYIHAHRGIPVMSNPVDPTNRNLCKDVRNTDVWLLIERYASLTLHRLRSYHTQTERLKVWDIFMANYEFMQHIFARNPVYKALNASWSLITRELNADWLKDWKFSEIGLNKRKRVKLVPLTGKGQRFMRDIQRKGCMEIEGFYKPLIYKALNGRDVLKEAKQRSGCLHGGVNSTRSESNRDITLLLLCLSGDVVSVTFELR